jgi:hypothetical protein
MLAKDISTEIEYTLHAVGVLVWFSSLTGCVSLKRDLKMTFVPK